MDKEATKPKKEQTGYSSVLGEYKPPEEGGFTSSKSGKKDQTGYSSVLGEYKPPGNNNVKKKEGSVPYNSAEHPSVPEEEIDPELEPKDSNSKLLKKDSVGYNALEGEYTASVSGSIGKMNSMEAPFPSMTSQTIQTTMAPNDVLLATHNANIALSQFPTSVSIKTTQPIMTPVIDPLLNPILSPGTVQTTTINPVIPVGTVHSTPIITPVQTTTINPILPVGTVHSTINPILPAGSIQTTTINPIVTTKTVQTSINPILTPVQTTYTVTTKTTTTEYTTSGVNQFGTPTIIQSVPIGQPIAGATFDTYPTITSVNGVPSTVVPSIDPLPK